MEKLRWVKSTAHDDGEVKELRCPKCGCEKILGMHPEDRAEDDFRFLDLGKKVTCFECGHKFTVTENCWKLKNG